MALHRAKPNSARKRINKIARAVMADLTGRARSNPYSRKHNYGVSDAQIKSAVKSAVSRWESVKHAGPEAKAAAGFGRGDAQQWWSHIMSGNARQSTPGEKALRAKVKREVANALGMPQRKATRGKASQYRATGKYEDASFFGGKVKSRRRKVPKKPKGVQASAWYDQIGGKAGYASQYGATQFSGYNADRMAFRQSSAQYGGPGQPWKAPIGPGVITWKDGPPYKASGHVLAGLPSRGKVQGPTYNDLKKSAKAQGLLTPGGGSGKKGAYTKADLEALLGGRSNPFVGDIALTNPGFGGVASYLTGYAVPVAVAGGAAGAVHALASTQGWTETLAENVEKIPAVGEFIGQNMPYTLQGLLVGTGLAMVAPMVGGQAGKYLALTGGAALVFGGGIDAFNYMLGEEEGEEAEDLVEDIELDEDLLDEDLDVGALVFGDIALENVSALGDLAFAQPNVSALGSIGLENPLSQLSAPSPLAGDDLAGLYDQASLADAYYSGADFSGEEGQALINRSFKRRARRTLSRRAGRRVKHGASHLAGKAYHRWGWLIRLQGEEKCRQFAMLPPAQRLRVIAAMRKAAIQAYQQGLLQDQAVAAEVSSPDPELVPLPASGTVAGGANGVTGASGAGELAGLNYLGDPALFMGA